MWLSRLAASPGVQIHGHIGSLVWGGGTPVAGMGSVCSPESTLWTEDLQVCL